MTRLQLQSGSAVSLGRELGRGGEGSVFELQQREGLVGKIYHTPPDAERVAKLKAMIRLASPELLKFAAWPQDLLVNTAGDPVGFMMPKVSGRKDVHVLYSPSHRKTEFPSADWSFLLHTGLNLAIAFQGVHNAGCVIGDVNQGNVRVASDATVVLVDCDSFQVSEASRTFRCRVGVGHFTPPELQGVRFEQVDRTPNHDAFGLATMLFHLLAMGRHPFAGQFIGGENPSLEDAIRDRRFAFGPQSTSRRMMPPPNSLPFEALGPAGPLFERAFTSLTRPTARDWIECLRAMMAPIDTCPRNRGHRYVRGLSACPWCAMIGRGGPDYFVTVALHGVGTTFAAGVFNLDACWRLVEGAPALPNPNSELVISPSVVGVPYSPVLIERARRLFRAKLGLWTGFLIGLFGFLSPGLFIVAAFFVVLATVSRWRSADGRMLALERDRRHTLRSELQSRRANEERSLQELRVVMFDRRNSQLQRLKEARNELLELRQKFDAECRAMESSARDRQLEAFLDRHYIDDAKIAGIGTARSATLASYGIETAKDIRYGSIRTIPGFGTSLTNALLEWRARIESSFRWNSSQGVSDLDKRQLVLKFDLRRQELEKALTAGAGAFRAMAEEDVQAIRTQISQVNRTIMEERQADADASMPSS